MSKIITFEQYYKSNPRRLNQLVAPNGSALMSYHGSGVSIKAVDPVNRTIEGTLIPYTPPHPIDLHQQYFNSETETLPEQYPIVDKNGVGIPMMFNHGFDPVFGSTKIGQFIYADELESGWWVQARLKEYEEYVEFLTSVNERRDFGLTRDKTAKLAKAMDDALMQLLSQGVLGFSSGARPPDVKVADDGHIMVWYPIEGSLTPTPAAPSGTEARLGQKDAQLLQSLIVASQSSEEASDTTESMQTSDEPQETIIDLGGSAAKTSRDPNEDDDEGKPAGYGRYKTMQDLITKLQELIAMLMQEFGESADEMPSEEAERLAEQAARDAGITADAEPTTEQASAAEQAVAKSVAQLIGNKREAREKAEKDMRQRAIDLREQHAPLASRVGNQGAAQAGRITVGASQKYAHMSPEDMAYYYAFMSGMKRHGRFEVDEDFVPELLSKLDEVEKNPQAYAMPGYGSSHKPKFSKSVQSHLKALRGMDRSSMHRAIKANELMHTGQAGFGAEWVPDLWLEQIQELARVDNVVAPRLMSIDMPSNPFNIPLEGADPTVESIPETTDVTQLTDGAGNPMTLQKIATSNTQLDAKKLALRVGFSAEQEEDNIVPLIPIMRSKGQRALLDAIDSVLLNADPDTGLTNINFFGAAPAAKSDYLLGWTGILHDAVSDVATYGVDAGNAAPTIQMIRSVRKKMPKRYGSKLNELMWLCDYKTYVTLTNLEQFLTIDKVGPQATVLTGMLGTLDGIPVYMSGEIAESDANGRVDGVTAGNNTQGRLVLTHSQSRWMGFRRTPRVNVVYREEYDAYLMIASVRIAYTQYDSDGVTLLYNIAV